MSDNSYNQLKKITDEFYSDKRNKYAQDVLILMSNYNIKPRQKDGALHSVNISIPKSKPDSILVGLRYIKQDKTCTEDAFLFEKGKSIERFYRGRIEESLPEYKNTHKEQL